MGDWDRVEQKGTKSLVMVSRGFTIEAASIKVDGKTAIVRLAPRATSRRHREQDIPGCFPEDLWLDVNSAARLVEIPESLHHTAIATLIAPHLVKAKRPWENIGMGSWVIYVKDPSIQASETPKTITIKNIWVWGNEHGSGVSVGDYEGVRPP